MQSILNSFFNTGKKVERHLPKFYTTLILLLMIGLVMSNFKQSQQKTINNLEGKINILRSKVDKIGIIQEEVKIEKDILVLEKDKAIMQNTSDLNFLQSIGAVFVLLSAYIGWRTLGVAESKQVTERFSKVIDHLGSKEIEIRFGGIYALEQIAIDSPDKYHWTFVEILSAFIREKSLLLKENETPTSDIYTAFNVLGRRKVGEDPFNGKVDFTSVNLSKVIADKVRFSKADFSQSNFSNSSINKGWFKAANLSRVDFGGSKLNDVNFENADLTNAIFKGAEFTKINLKGADLTGSDLTIEQLQSSITNSKTKLPESCKKS
jgi:Pentapeptide repeats (8 copies)